MSQRGRHRSLNLTHPDLTHLPGSHRVRRGDPSLETGRVRRLFPYCNPVPEVPRADPVTRIVGLKYRPTRHSVTDNIRHSTWWRDPAGEREDGVGNPVG